MKPKYFLFENVASMSHYWRDEITKLVGVEPIKLNSKYWGAQSRNRLFWTNIPGAKLIEQNQIQNDRKIYLKDILIDGAVDCEKSKCLTARYGGTQTSEKGLKRYYEKRMAQIVFTGITQEEYDALFISSDKQLQILTNDKTSDDIVKVATIGGNSQGQRIYGRQGKSQTLSASGGGLGAKTGLVFACLTPDRINKRQNGSRFKKDGKMFTLTAQDRHGVYHKELGIRKLHPVECERLMNLPDNYTEGVSKTQRYIMLGNGWDVDVIAEILRNID